MRSVVVCSDVLLKDGAEAVDEAALLLVGVFVVDHVELEEDVLRVQRDVDAFRKGAAGDIGRIGIHQGVPFVEELFGHVGVVGAEENVHIHLVLQGVLTLDAAGFVDDERVVFDGLQGQGMLPGQWVARRHGHVDWVGVEEREFDVAWDVVEEVFEGVGDEHIADITGMLGDFFDDVVLVTLLAVELHLWEIVFVVDVDDGQNADADHWRGMNVHLAADDFGGVFLEGGNLPQHLVVTGDDGLGGAEDFATAFGQGDAFFGTVEQWEADFVLQVAERLVQTLLRDKDFLTGCVDGTCFNDFDQEF